MYAIIRVVTTLVDRDRMILDPNSPPLIVEEPFRAMMSAINANVDAVVPTSIEMGRIMTQRRSGNRTHARQITTASLTIGGSVDVHRDTEFAALIRMVANLILAASSRSDWSISGVLRRYVMTARSEAQYMVEMA